MSASAVCITGLTICEVADFSFCGQLILSLLIQCGAVGIMTLSASVLLALGRGLSFSDTLMISNLNDNFSLRRTESLTRTIIHYMLLSEAVGAVLMWPGLWFNGYGFFTSLWYAIFLAVNSFCNSGMTPFTDSLASQNQWTQSVAMALMILGGLGVYVVYDLRTFLKHRQRQLRLHSLVVLSSTGILLLSGTLLMWLLSRSGGVELSWFDALFFSATSRTNGFFTVDPTNLSPSCITVLIILMLIGGSPGSTAGGMKTTTVAVALSAIANTFQGNPQVLMFRRAISVGSVLRAFSIIMIFILLVCGGTVGIQMLNPDLQLGRCLFEAISALTTTGLSLGGTTGALTPGGELFVALCMFIGRLGPFTIMLFLLSREKPGHLKYPEERVIIG